MKNFYKGMVLLSLLLSTLFSVAQENDTLTIRRNENGKISYARFKPTANIKISEGKKILNQLLKVNKGDDFLLKRKYTDKFGITHLRYQQLYKGIKIESAQYLIHGKNENVNVINGNFEIINIPSIQPVITKPNALDKALRYVDAVKYKWEDNRLEEFIKKRTNNPNASYYPNGELVIAKDNLNEKGKFKLAWKFNISSLTPENEQIIYIDAETGNVMGEVELLLDSNITLNAETSYSGTLSITGDSFSGGYRLREIKTTTSGNSVNLTTFDIQNGSNYATAVDFTNNTTTWTNGTWSDFGQDQPALDVHWGIEQVLDYWSSIQLRNSIDNSGLDVVSYVHYFVPNTSAWPNNAQWDPVGLAMRYGDGDGINFNPVVALDVTAHEMAHGINQFESNLGSSVGLDQSDALNEGLSDIWGAVVENWTNSGKNTWRIGEEVIISSLDIQVMLTPHSGHIDPPKDFGQKDKLMTILQFFSKTFSLKFYSMGSVYQPV